MSPWSVLCVNHLSGDSHEAAEIAALHNELKCAHIEYHIVFEPITVETLDVINPSACLRLINGKRIPRISGKDRESYCVSVHFSNVAVIETALIITGGTCCGQEAQSVNDTSGGRSGTQSCWWSYADLI